MMPGSMVRLNRCMMKINTVVNALEENTYVVHQNQDVLIIDPGSNTQALMRILDALDIPPIAVLLTHAHIDHISGLNAFLKRFNVPIWVHEADEPMLHDPNLNLSKQLGQPFSLKELATIHTFMDDTIIEVGHLQITTLTTPGHTSGGACYAIENVVFSGDTLFYRSVGRTDFPGGSTRVLKRSLQKLMNTLPPNTRVLPGHGPATTLRDEQRHNPYLI